MGRRCSWPATSTALTTSWSNYLTSVPYYYCFNYCTVPLCTVGQVAYYCRSILKEGYSRYTTPEPGSQGTKLGIYYLGS